MRAICAVLLLFVVGMTPGAQDRPRAPYRSAIAALVLDPKVPEISGMAASGRDANLVWVHNDSDGGPRLYALGTDGHVRSAVTIAGVRNQDWEDLAAWTEDGTSYLLIGDTGDNGGSRREIELIALVEPDPGVTEQVVEPLWRLRVRWPDGPRDCEGVAVDLAARQILLISKRRVPAQLFAVPLGPPATPDTVLTAQQIASITNIPQPSKAEIERDPQFGRFRAQITAMDLSRDGRSLAVLTYRDVYVYHRAPGEHWRDAFYRRPEPLSLPPLPQGEAIAFGHDGKTIWVTSERLPAPLIRLQLQ